MNPDEIVTLRNKKTGDVKKVKRSELPSLGLPIDYVSKIDAQIKLGQQGNVNITDVAKTDPQAALIMQQAGVMPIEKSKDTSTFDASTNLINELEQKYMQAKGGEYTGLGALISGTKKNIAGGLNLDVDAKTYNKIRKGFTANLKSLTGDTGVLTQQDYERIANLLPSFTDDPKTAKELFNVLRSQVAAKFGGEKSETSYQAPESKGGALAATLPGVAQAYKTQQQNVQQYSGGEAGLIETMLKGTPQGVLLQKGGGQAAGEILSLLGFGNLAKGAVGKAKGLTTKGALANRSNVAAEQSAKISGESVYKKAEEKVLKTISETDRKSAVKMLESAKEGLAGKSFDAQTVLEKLAQYNKAYTTTGRAGKSAKAAVNDALSKALREEMKTNMPNVFAAQEQLKTALGLGKNVRRTVGAVSLGAGGVAATAYLLNLLRGKSQK